MSYTPVRNADIMWMKRVWRRIDLRQKLNHPFYFPERPSNGLESLFDHMILAILEGRINAYDPGVLGDDDMFTKRLTAQEVRELLISIDTVITDDPETMESVYVAVETAIRSTDVILYEIKEEWYFDKQRSVMDVRIIGICPLVRVTDEITGQFRGYKKLFWISFEESRYEMSNWTAFNRGNDVEQRTFEELFTKRIFDSYIVKESNVYDRAIQEYASGEEALLEAERIERRILEMEHDLWSR